MRITLLGAAGGEVTGSSYLVETSRAKILVDCGLFQGGPQADALNRAAMPDACRALDAVVLTHAHLDHTGRLPLLTRAGFAGPVFATPATVDMTGLILRDAAKIQAQDAERHNRRRERAGEPPFVPLYSVADAEQIISQLRAAPYREPVSVAPGIQVRFVEAGHMLGSASLQLLVDDGGQRRTVVFSGDLGPKSAPILREFEPFTQADLVFCESTYGDHDHQQFAQTVTEFIAILRDAIAGGGKVLVPTFAVGRAQLLTALLAWAFRHKELKPFPAFLDSPMAIEASRIYDKHGELFDDEMVAFLRERPIRHDLSTLRMTATADESRAINAVPGPCLIMAGAGMCTAGRILHHLRHNLWSPQAHVIIVGYQGRGTLGRQLVDGATRVSIFGEPIVVRAKIHTLGGFSAHAGQTDLLAWMSALAPVKPRVVLTHGEDQPRTTLAALIKERFGLVPHLPAIGEIIEL
ncbi:MBL fold metallo-hydrolase RNA specificity domain-containing protein [Opitutus terrae]|uniref:Beta-lactamase domain protein n=1 Tax=Opitutus terrae (strain DSM 11246 / JCM 15787 / PB90-1) TaxID=452637 RepID=B1ZSI7_OPITP|nr:MBL fold metallo-hydrolase [Opitutus terrae]ACB73844.1 beta-lactamase domain protein [Opitutus terrae PB90-1]